MKSIQDATVLIQEVLHQTSKNAAELMDEECGEEIKLITEQLAYTFFSLNILVNHTDQDKINNIQFESKMLFWQGANSLVASLQLIRQGYFAETHAVFRHAVEGLAMAAELYLHPEKHGLFVSGKLHGQSCIGSAKELVPIFGEMYGALSEVAHPGHKMLGSYVYSDDKSTTLLIGGHVKPGAMYRHRMNLNLCAFISQVYFSVIDLIFYEFIPEHHFWQRNKNGYIWSPNVHQQEFGLAIQKSMFECLQSINNTSNQQ